MKRIIALGGVAGLALGTLACCQPAYAAPTDPDADAQCAAAWPGLSQGASDDGECALGGGVITTDADGNGAFAGHGSWQVSDGDTTATSTAGTGTFTGAPSTTYIVGFYGRSDVPGANACDTLTMTAVAVPSEEPPSPVPSEEPPSPVPSEEPPSPVPSEEPSSPEALPSITPTVPDTTPGHGTVVPSSQSSESAEPAAPKADDATTVDATADESSDSEPSSPGVVESSIPVASEAPSAEVSESAAPAEHHGLPRTGGNGTAFALGALAGLVAATAALLTLGYRASKER